MIHNYFSQKAELRKHLWIALILGMLLRLVSLIFVWGPQGLDDYLDNIIPAWRFLEGQDSLLHDYRSPLYMLILSLWLKVGQWFGIEQAVPQIRWIYFLQASVSMLSIVGVYLLAKRSKNPVVPVLAVYLTAMQGLMPFVSTRAFMESFVMGPVVLAFALLIPHLKVQKISASVIGGYFLLGLSSLVRFQAGIFYVAWLILALYRKNKRLFLFGFLFGFLLLAAEALVDLGFGRAAFGTLKAYILFNSNPANAPAMPWYNTWLTWLGFMYFPFSFALWGGWRKAFREHQEVLFLAIAYALVHSMSPHKEERYLYPLLPLSMILWAEAWATVIETRRVRWFYNPCFVIFNTLVLSVGCLVNTQVGLIGPFADLGMNSKKVLYLDFDNFQMRNYMAPFFVRPPSRFANIDFSNSGRAEQIQQLLDKSEGLDAVLVLSSLPERESAFNVLQENLAKIWNCSTMKNASSLSDQFLYWLDPKLNSRRAGEFYFYCRKS